MPFDFTIPYEKIVYVKLSIIKIDNNARITEGTNNAINFRIYDNLSWKNLSNTYTIKIGIKHKRDNRLLV